MEKQYAIIQAGKVINVVLWNGKSTWQYEGELVELTDNAGIGWDYIDGKFVDNRPVEIES
jgi:hypothetical protein